jgi:hypothetical protein
VGVGLLDPGVQRSISEVTAPRVLPWFGTGGVFKRLLTPLTGTANALIYGSTPLLNPGLYSKAFATDEERGPVYTGALEKAQDAAANVLKAFENDAGRLPKRVQLSEFRNEIDDYVFKLCSKLLHPTALSILVWPNVTDAQLETNRVHLRTLALYYADVGLDALLVGLC